MRRQNNDQFSPNQFFILTPKQQANQWDVAQKWHFVFTVIVTLINQPANDNSLPVSDSHRGRSGSLNNPGSLNILGRLIRVFG